MLLSLNMDNLKINHYNICYKIGKKYSKQIKNRVVDDYKRTVGFDEKKVEFLKDKFPNYWEELRGIADGSKTPFDKVMAMNTYDVYLKGCSTIVSFDKNGTPIIGHNEDAPEKMPSGKIAKLLEFNYLDSQFTSLVYFGELAGNSFSFNRHGIAIFMDFINGIEGKNIKNSVPNYFLFRKILDCKTINEALKIFKKHSSSTGYHCIVSQNGKVYSVEKLYNKIKILKITKDFIHTNFFVSKDFMGKDKPKKNSVEGFKGVSKMMEEKYPLKKILLNKLGAPNAICGGYRDSTKTLASIIFNAKINKIVFYKTHK